MPEFVHLHTHSHYSLLDGATKISELAKTAQKFKMPALALTDHGNMFGAIEFYKTMQKARIKPIIGVETYITRGSSEDRGAAADVSYHLVLLAKNLKGYKNLTRLVSHGFLKGFYYKPRIDKELLRKHCEGLIALSACLKGEINQFLLKDMEEEARQTALEYQEMFDGNYYLELQDHGIEEEQKIRPQIIKLSKELNIPLVATNDVHYLKREHYEAHDILLCLQTGKDYDDPNRMRYSTDQIYFKSPDEMAQLFADVPEAIENTIAVAEKCNLLLDMETMHLPYFNLPDDEPANDLDEYLEKVTYEGLKGRYNEITPEIKERADKELKVIKSAKYAGYFLIVKDFIDYARSQDIPVGPGRGSAAGSLVSYALSITNIDPLKYGLMFERFLNIHRLSMPDIDIDFCFERRGEIIDYVKRKYGEDCVAQIITFGTMAARAVIRDVGRVLRISYGEVDKIAKLIPIKPGTTLEGALKSVPELAELVKSDPKYEKLIEYSKTLEGLARHASTHAAGVVITPTDLTNYVPLYKTKDGDITTQYSMKLLENIGLLKMDFLGLRTLTVIDKALKAIKAKGIDLDINAISLDDDETYKIFAEGKTVGVFQFESAGMRDWLKKLCPKTLDDLIAMNALYRPGPMDWIQDFIARKHGHQKIEYIHSALEPVLGETFGFMVYQEQVMKTAVDLAGFSLSEADQLRWAMGKKNEKMMADLEGPFIDGAKEHHSINENLSKELYEQMKKFAGYGFNKSHATGYAYIAYQTAYLKAHHPAEFMAANLTSEMGNSKRIVVLTEECRKMEIQILPPDVNESFADFVVVDDAIRFGLGAIKNVGLGAIESIVKARKEDGQFFDIFDLCKRIDQRLVNRRVIESLILAGAMDSLGAHRAQLLTVLDTAVAYGQEAQIERESGQTSIFGDDQEKESLIPKLPEKEEWTESELLSNEKRVLGLYVSGHPLSRFEDEVRTFATFSLDDLETAVDEDAVKVCGIVTDFKTQVDSKGNTMAFFSVEDFSGTGECLMFSTQFADYRQFLQADALVMVVGKMSVREDKGSKIIAEEIIPLTEVQTRYTKSINLVLNVNDIEQDTVTKLGKVLDKSKGDKCVFITLKSNGSEFVMRSKQYQISPSAHLINSLRTILGKENVWIGG